MTECIQLSVTELDNLLAQGWTIVGGPFNTSEECSSECGSGPGGISTLCCPGVLLPSAFTGTFGGGLASLGTVALIYSDAFPNPTWLGIVEGCPSGDVVLRIYISVTCTGSNFSTEFRSFYVIGGVEEPDACADNIESADTLSCNPLQISFTGLVSENISCSLCGTGDGSFIVTA